MSKSTKFYGEWAQYDGQIVVIDGIKHRLSCRVSSQLYPYSDEVISVDATPVSKSTKFYRDIKAQLGDDWSTDVLASDVEVEADVLRQLRARGVKFMETPFDDDDESLVFAGTTR